MALKCAEPQLGQVATGADPHPMLGHHQPVANSVFVRISISGNICIFW